MIRRISKHNDLKDIIKSCPSGVIDDIYAIEYYIQGNNVVINASFTQVGNELVVVLPTSQLELLPNGILMRRAFYKVVDTSYPDGYYNLEFEDNMNIWLGDYESEEPVIPEYVTEDSLSSTLSSYATQDWVNSQQFLTSESLPSNLATQSWVRSYTYDSSTIVAACGKAEDNAITWVQEQGYLTASTIPSDIATQSWVSSYFYTKSYIDEVEINNEIRMKAIEVSLDESYATMSWVQSQGYITVEDLPSGLATQSWVENYTYDKSMIAALVGKARVDALSDAQEWVSSQQFATQSWVQSQGYLTSVPSEYATKSWVESYTFDQTTIGQIGQKATGDAIDWVQEQGYLTQHQDLTGYATQSWVESYTYDSSTIDAACGKAEDNAITWVQEQGYLTVGDLPSGLATQSWVASYTYDKSIIDALVGKAQVDALSDAQAWVSSQQFATQSWVNSQFATLEMVAALDNALVGAEEHILGLEGSYAALSAYFDAFVSEFVSTSYATESWVQSQSYLTSASISTYVTESAIESMGFATQSWVSSQGYLTSVPSEYATESFVTSALSGYATESWVSSNYFAESKIWTGTMSQWALLTSAQQALYTIALITE